ncbi:MAG: IPT/TIG domain-containing protein [Candidatus Sericytochromatia bacterium]|nr:IPT/TIG domain-containing protein [Candidatus Sericytochromatia bacterium]
MRYSSLSLFVLLSLLAACQSSPELTSMPNPASPLQQSPVVSPVLLRPARMEWHGNQLTLHLDLPALPAFKTQALDFASATKVKALVTDSFNLVTRPNGSDAQGQVNYPVGGNLSLTFNNLIPDQLLLLELSVNDGVALIPQAELASVISHPGINNANVEVSFLSTPAAKVMKSLMATNLTRAKAIVLADLNTLINQITGVAGTYPNYTYTTHPTLINLTQLANDLLSQNPGALTPANYRLNGSTVNATVTGLVGADQARLQLTDSATPVVTAAGNGVTAFVKSTPGSGLRLLASSAGTPGTTYTYAVATNPVTSTEGGTHAVTVTATPATPSITSLGASAGPIGSSVTLNGTNFHATTGGNTVRFGTTIATVTAASNTQLTVTVPVGITGAQDISVQVGNQTSANTAADNFNVTPTITNLSASNGAIGSTLTITGTGFDATPGNNTVRFGTTTATVNTASATSLNVTVPAGIFGSQNVTVTVAGQTNVGTNNYAVTPAITNLTPIAGNVGSSMTINGSGFHTTLGSNTVSFGGTAATVTAATTTQLTVTVPNNVGVQNVTVQVGAQTNAGTNNYTVSAAGPTITNLSASNGTIGSALTITGTGFDTTPGNNTVRFGTTTATVNTASVTSLNVTVPAGIFGSQNVTVTVAGQTNAGTNNYAVTPAITGFTSAGTSSDVAGASITINGSGFHTTLGSNTVSFGGTNATVTGATATALTVTVPSLTSNAAPYATTVQVGTQTSAGSNFTVMPRITTFAGSTQGFSGDNGAAASAQLNAPWGVSINASNHVAIADSSNHRIRFVPASNGDFFGVAGMTAGNIYTLAGNGTGTFAGDNGAGTSAQVNDPHGIALIGNILLTFADTANQRVRTLSNTTATFYNIAMTAGSIYTVNGSGTNGAATDGTARFAANMASPEGVADQGNGTLIADTGNNVAYFSNLLTGPATRFGRTVAGSNIYFVAGGGFGGSALNSPSGIHRVANATNGGHVYIADAGSHRIFFRPDTAGNYFGQVMAADTLYVIAGDGNAGATGDGGSATSARLSSPRGVFANATGVFIADTGNHKIRFIPITSGNYYGQAMTANFIYTLAGTGAAALAGDNSIAGLAQLNNPTGVSVDSTGQVYVADRLNHRVRRISP